MYMVYGAGEVFSTEKRWVDFCQAFRRSGTRRPSRAAVPDAALKALPTLPTPTNESCLHRTQPKPR